MVKYTAALIIILTAVLIGCNGTNSPEVPEADPSEVLEQAVKAMEHNPSFRIEVGWIDSEGEAVLQDCRDLQFVLPDRLFCRQAPGYEVIPFIIIIGEQMYISGDGIRWEEPGREIGAEYYQGYYQIWNPYEFLKHAGNSTSAGTDIIDGILCRIIEADVNIDAWGNRTGWVTDRTNVRLVVYIDAGSQLPLRVTVLWREQYPQGTTERPYVIGISYDDTISIEQPGEVLSETELDTLEQDLNSEIEECAEELVWILSAFKEANGFFSERLDPDTVSDVMQAAGLEWPVNPVTGSPMSDGDFIPGYYCYRSLDDGSDYELSVCSYYSCSRFTYHGLPVEPTIIPWLTDEQKERALEIALADPRVQEILEGRQYDVGDIGRITMGSKLLGAIVDIDLKEPCIIEYDWPFSRTDEDGYMIEAGTRHEMAGVETLDITVNLEAEKVVSIQPWSFRVFR